MTAPDRTPRYTPWFTEYDDDTGQHRIYDCGSSLIACVGNVAMDLDEQADKAAFIVEACNAYNSRQANRDELLAALEALTAECERIPYVIGNTTLDIKALCARARPLLSKVKG